ncbi:hypothetical protein WJU16_18610 [Chitinophaga pollutisoli]|uniref:Major facilitator superfamily (MFS) profile domain-containing protein n=1 Tax=Chitinophaga pollutisoli TaxID=3133966 RepID=A0ABZ2YKF7_9BACT
MNSANKPVKLLNAAVIVASLGYFVDIYDLLLFGIIRIKSLASLGLSPSEIDSVGMWLINIQMVGMLIGGIIWGVLGDKRGRLSVLFGSILLYSVANVANGMVGEKMPFSGIWSGVSWRGWAWRESWARGSPSCRKCYRRKSAASAP